MRDTGHFAPEESVTRHDVAWFVETEETGLETRSQRARVPLTHVLPSLVLLLAAGDPVSSAVTTMSDRAVLETQSGSAAAQTGARAFRDTRGISLAEARRMVSDALRKAQEERRAEREAEARLLASFEE